MLNGTYFFNECFVYFFVDERDEDMKVAFNMGKGKNFPP
jgi:hypothetical protein